MKRHDFDYIIVGAGSAGCVLANRLTANPAARVLLLEAGGMDRNFWIHLPVGYFRTIFNPRLSRSFDTESFDGAERRTIAWPRGRVLGGSSSINGLLYVRGQRQDFDDWAELGLAGWDYRSVLPYFRRSERYEGKASEFHGTDGELGVTELRNDHPWCATWLEAAQQRGLPRTPDLNGAMDRGVTTYQLTVRNGWRSSAATAFLHPVLHRTNLRLVTQTLVTRVLFSGQTANGVEWIEDGKRRQANAACEVILAAGAIQSPQLLQLSGIGAASLLRQHGISVRVDAPEVGENLQDHYKVSTVVRFKQPLSLNNQIRNPIELAKMGAQWMFKDAGPLTVGAGQVGGRAKSEYAIDDRDDININVMPLSLDKVGQPLHRFPGLSIAASQCRPRSLGRLAIEATDPRVPPRIESNYLADDHDKRVLVAGMRMVREILNQHAFRGQIEDEYLPGRARQSNAELLAYARAKGGTSYHPVGTCRMGSDERSVVDAELRVRGVERLRVIDASIMPRLTSGNTNAPTIMIGEKGADMIQAHAARRSRED